MTDLQKDTRHSQSGFTLVELAIVMVIIGLLIGGILKGQELIANAKISSSVSQLKSTDAALNTFQDKYNALPGDMGNAGTRLPGCTAAPCNVAGNNNSRIGANFAVFPGAATETGVSFAHLSASDLISGIDVTGASATFGRMLPTLKAGGGFWIVYSDAAITNTGVVSARHYAILSTVPTATTAGLTPSVAAQIDRKLDDGIPTTGGFSVTGTNCINAGAYDEAAGAGTCLGYVRVLN